MPPMMHAPSVDNLTQEVMLGGCSHPKMRKVTVYRHDEAHRMLLKGIINKGRMGSFLVIADVSKSEKLRPIRGAPQAPPTGSSRNQ